MSTLGDYIDQVRQLVHDLNGTDWSDAEITSRVNESRQRIAVDTSCVRPLKVQLQAIQGQEDYPSTGAIGGVNVLTGGSGYASAPTVVFTGGDYDTIATATATVSGGEVTEVTMTSWGSGYQSEPVVTVTGGGGTGATVEGVMLKKVIDVISVTILWNNLRYMTSRAVWTQFQAYMRMNPLWLQNPGVYCYIREREKIYLSPIPDQSQAYFMEWDVICLPDDLTAEAEEDTQIRLPGNDAVQFYAAHMCLLKLQNFDQADVMRKLYKMRISEILKTQAGPYISNAYRAYAARMWRT